MQGHLAAASVTLASKQYALLGAVQGPSLVTPLAEKVVIGEHKPVDDVLLSTWTPGWRGGLGVLDLNTDTQADRYHFGSLWALQDRALMLPAGPIEVTTGIPASTTSRLSVTFLNVTYTVFNTKVRYYANVTADFQTPAEAGYVDLGANGTDATVVRLGTSDRLFIADGAGLLRFDGTTWAYQTGNGSTIPLAQFLEPFDNKLYALDVNGKLWSTLDGTTWTALTGLPVLSGEARGLDMFWDPDNHPRLHAPTREGLWFYDEDSNIWVRTRLAGPGFPPHLHGGEGHSQWRDEYFMSAGMEAYHYLNSGVITPASLSRDDGLPADYQGNIVAFEALPSWLVAAVSSDETVSGLQTVFEATGWAAGIVPTTAGLSALYLWTGSAWQPLWLSPTSGAAVSWLHWSTGNSTYRLWWGTGARVFYLDFANAIFNPRHRPTWPFAASGFQESGRFDKDWPEQIGVAMQTVVRFHPASVGDAVAIFARRDHATAYALVGTVTAEGLTTFIHESATDVDDGLPFYDWQYRYEMTAGVTGLSPILEFVKLEYARRPDARYGYRFNIAVHEGFNGQTVEQQIVALQALSATKTKVPFSYRPGTRDLVARTVMITGCTAITVPGLEGHATYQISLVEP